MITPSISQSLRNHPMVWLTSLACAFGWITYTLFPGALEKLTRSPQKIIRPDEAMELDRADDKIIFCLDTVRSLAEKHNLLYSNNNTDQRAPSQQILRQDLADPGREDDIEWNKLPRRSDAIRDLFVNPNSWTADYIFRSRDLNPSDIYIDPTMRFALRSLVSQYLDTIRDLHDKTSRYYAAEFSAAVDLGMADKIKTRLEIQGTTASFDLPLLNTIDEESFIRIPQQSHFKDRAILHRVRSSDMPSFLAWRTKLRFLCADLAFNLSNIFYMIKVSDSASQSRTQKTISEFTKQ